MPEGIPYIIANDIAERFSFYGMRAILVVFMTQYLMTSDGALSTMSRADEVAVHSS
jgi:POT family proton-dependent oligopeptide transporter|tara:strand:+ start:529 stop:696 length:168 start_codon:yes stop_codon:yes gene_type:complete